MKRINKDLHEYMQKQGREELAKEDAFLAERKAFWHGKPKVQICAGAGVAMVIPIGAKSLSDALYTQRYFKGATTPAPTEFGQMGKEKREEWALSQVRQWAEAQGYEVEEIQAAPW